MRGELRNIEYKEFSYSTAEGFFFDGNNAYVVKVFDGGKTDNLGIKVFNENEELVDTVYHQPSLHGTGLEESLSMKSKEANLPETDEQLEAYARYVLQENTGIGLEYEGPRDLDELEY